MTDAAAAATPAANLSAAASAPTSSLPTDTAAGAGPGAPERTNAPNDPASQTAAQDAAQAAADKAAASDKPETTSQIVGRVVDAWLANVRSGANPITRDGLASNFLFEQCPALKSALTRALKDQ